MKAHAKRILSTLSPSSPSRAGSRFVYYHSVHPSLPRSIRPERFSEHLDVMTELGLEFVSHAEAVSRISAGDDSRWIVLGFDDGYEDNHSIVLDLLASRGATATFYVVSGQVTDDGQIADGGYQLFDGYRMLSSQQVREIAQAGHEVASHGKRHVLHSHVPVANGELARELRDSREHLSELAGAPVVSHSYPNGQRGAFNDGTRRSVKEAGFQSSATTLWGRATARSPMFALPRCEVSNSDTASDLRDKLTGRHDYRWIAHRLRRSPTWN